MAELNGTTFLSGANAEFIAELYARYLDDPAAVDPSWRRFFAEMADDAAAIRAERAGPPWARPLPPIEMPEAPSPTPAVDGGAVQQAYRDSPVAYLLRLDEELTPQTMPARAGHWVRPFVMGI